MNRLIVLAVAALCGPAADARAEMINYELLGTVTSSRYLFGDEWHSEGTPLAGWISFDPGATWASAPGGVLSSTVAGRLSVYSPSWWVSQYHVWVDGELAVELLPNDPLTGRPGLRLSADDGGGPWWGNAFSLSVPLPAGWDAGSAAAPDLTRLSGPTALLHARGDYHEYYAEVQVRGEHAPEPSSVLLAGLGVVAGAFAGRRGGTRMTQRAAPSRATPTP